jgi:hypothetical protein
MASGSPGQSLTSEVRRGSCGRHGRGRAAVSYLAIFKRELCWRCSRAAQRKLVVVVAGAASVSRARRRRDVAGGVRAGDAAK